MKGDHQKAFGYVLKELRRKAEFTQQELADYADTDRTFISNLERGTQSPTLDKVFKLAEILKTKPSELLVLVEKQMK